MLDSFSMRRVLQLAAGPARSPSPNPRVGALVVKSGHVVGTGFHNGPGTKHAEEVALEAAGAAARGATLYCNLEPCAHSTPAKHRPPCVPLIARSGVRRVVISHLDPNPAVQGRGKAILERAGIEVSVGVESREALELNAGFATYMMLGRPFVHIKVAQSLDGRLAAADGSSAWITNNEARADGHIERGRCDAVAVGVGTVLADNPLLSVRHGPARRPLAVVFDSKARTPTTTRLLAERPRETLVVVGPGADADRRRGIESTGARVLEALDLPGALEALAELGIRSLFVEGGRRLIASFLKARLYDRITCYIAPMLLGGTNNALEASVATTMDKAVRLAWSRSRVIGNQAVVTGYRPEWVERVEAATQVAADTPQPRDGRNTREVDYVYRSC